MEKHMKGLLKTGITLILRECHSATMRKGNRRSNVDRLDTLPTRLLAGYTQKHVPVFAKGIAEGGKGPYGRGGEAVGEKIRVLHLADPGEEGVIMLRRPGPKRPTKTVLPSCSSK